MTRISNRDDVCGGAWCIDGTRITVWGVVQYHQMGLTDRQIQDRIPGLTDDALQEVYAFWRRHRPEIEADIVANTIDVEEVAAATGIPVDEWPGRCADIAHATRLAVLPEAAERYGHYTGPVHPDSLFAGHPSPRHGWLETGHAIVDPTVWVFEASDPYIAVIPKGDPRCAFYDLGGVNLLRALGLAPHDRPPPTDEDCAGEKACPITWPVDTHEFLDRHFGRHEWLYVGQVIWLAHLPPWEVPEVIPVMRAIMRHREEEGGHYAAFIPIDMQHYVKDLDR